MATILVTGGSWLIGSYVLRRLVERGDTAINFDTREPDGELAWWLRPVAGRIQFVSGGIDTWGDVAIAVQKYAPDAIIHIAAVVNVPLLNGRPGLAAGVNFGGTFNVLEAARVFGVRAWSSLQHRRLPGIRTSPST